MQILRSIADLTAIPGPILLAVGTFDGLHLGHQALIRRVLDEADRISGTAVVMTFDRHPASLIRPDQAPSLLTRNATKLALLEELGVQVVLLLEFNEAIAAIPAEDFIQSLVISARPLSMICVGSQWSFGHGGVGNIPLLKQLGEEHAFSVTEIAPVNMEGIPISSTRIREAIASGNFKEVTACLGRSYLLCGKVVTGAGLGTKIGIPTANVDAKGMQLPPDGVYAVTVSDGARSFSGVANIGVRPTVDRSARRTVEVHLFNVSENLVDKELCLEFVLFLRGEQKFSDLASLTAQIAKDCEKAKEVLNYKG